VGKIIAINLTGPMRLMKAVAPVTKAQGQGRIVNIASVAGVGPTGSSIAYAVSKAGLIHLTRCMAVALAPRWRGPKLLARQARHFRECLSPASNLQIVLEFGSVLFRKSFVTLPDQRRLGDMRIAVEGGEVFGHRRETLKRRDLSPSPDDDALR
jgi:hypothetical protein